MATGNENFKTGVAFTPTYSIPEFIPLTVTPEKVNVEGGVGVGVGLEESLFLQPLKKIIIITNDIRRTMYDVRCTMLDVRCLTSNIVHLTSYIVYRTSNIVHLISKTQVSQ